MKQKKKIRTISGGVLVKLFIMSWRNVISWQTCTCINL